MNLYFLNKKDIIYFVMKQKITIENFPKFRIKFFFQVSLITLFNTLVFTGLGFFLDNIFQTKPLFLIIFVLASFPLTQYILYKYIKCL